MNVFLYNLATGECRKLPPSILPLTEPPCEPYSYDSCRDTLGFGYYANSRDFKVVRVVHVWEMFGFFLYMRMEIYDLSKDRWREIEAPDNDSYASITWMPWSELYHEGTYYWYSHRETNDMTNGEALQSFDMGKKVFSRILLPESFNIKEEGWEKRRSFGILNGSIVVFHYPAEMIEKIFDVWEMRKETETDVVLWSKLLTIGPVFGIDKPLLFLSSYEVLMEDNEGRDFV